MKRGINIRLGRCCELPFFFSVLVDFFKDRVYWILRAYKGCEVQGKDWPVLTTKMERYLYLDIVTWSDANIIFSSLLVDNPFPELNSERKAQLSSRLHRLLPPTRSSPSRSTWSELAAHTYVTGVQLSCRWRGLGCVQEELLFEGISKRNSMMIEFFYTFLCIWLVTTGSQPMAFSKCSSFLQ